MERGIAQLALRVHIRARLHKRLYFFHNAANTCDAQRTLAENPRLMHTLKAHSDKRGKTFLFVTAQNSQPRQLTRFRGLGISHGSRYHRAQLLLRRLRFQISSRRSNCGRGARAARCRRRGSGRCRRRRVLLRRRRRSLRCGDSRQWWPWRRNARYIRAQSELLQTGRIQLTGRLDTIGGLKFLQCSHAFRIPFAVGVAVVVTTLGQCTLDFLDAIGRGRLLLRYKSR